VSDFDFFHVPADSAVYLHVPFCSSICDFCAFDKALPETGDWDVFRESLAREWSKIRFAGAIKSVFWGGGTPGLLKASDILSVGGLFDNFLNAEAEWTVELTPLCPTTEKLSAWREVGVNRLSLGVQSFSPRLLEAMGRPYSVEKIPEIVHKIRQSGFESLNLDLIIAFPGQTENELVADLEKVVELEPEHVSAYCLTLEEDTALYTRLARQGTARDEEEEANLYRIAWSFLEEHGYRQYEISNFAKPGFECQHHLNVWRMGNWRGVGPSAASQVGAARFSNPHGLHQWAECVAQDKTPPLERIGRAERIKEKLCFGLRMNEGVGSEVIEELDGAEKEKLESFLGRLESEGYLSRKDGRIRLTFEGRMVADEISRWILD